VDGACTVLGGFTARVTLSEILLPVRQRMRAHGEGFLEAFRQAQRRGRRRFGAYIVHAGALLVIVAIAVSSTMALRRRSNSARGRPRPWAGYTLTFVNADRVAEPHRESVRARMDISKNGRSLGTPYPRMSRHERHGEPIGTPAVRTSLTEDLYLSIHTIDLASQTAGRLILVNPMVGWIWIATAVMALGGFVALVPAWRSETVAMRVAMPGVSLPAKGSDQPPAH